MKYCHLSFNPIAMAIAKKSTSAIYLAHLVFISGEYGQNFYVCIPANSLRDAEKRLDKYLMDYYPEEPQKSEDTYYYDHGQIAVKCLEIEELPVSSQKAYTRLCSILAIH